MLNLIGFVIFCGVSLILVFSQAANSRAQNRFPPTTDLALSDIFVAVNTLQDLLDNVDLNRLDYDQVQSIRSAQFRLETAIAAYAKQPERAR